MNTNLVLPPIPKMVGKIDVPQEMRIWNSYNKNKNGSPQVATEQTKNKIMTLYLDGKVIIRDPLSNNIEEKQVDSEILKDSINNYNSNKFKLIIISDLLKRTELKNTK